MPAPKRLDPLEVERDLDLILTLRLEGVLPRGKIYEEVNRVREEIAFRRARALGSTEAQARKIARAARISAVQFRTDLRKATARMEAQSNDKNRLLVFRRLKEVETAIAGVEAMEERAWNELNRSGKEKTERSADPRWMERIESLMWKRWQMNFEAFRLRTILGIEIPEDLAALAKSGDPAAAEKLRAHEAGLLLSMEARAAGLGGEMKSRLQMISAFIEKRGGGASGGEGGATRVQFEVIGLDVEGPGS